MAYASQIRRAVASLMISTMLVACSSEGLVPPAAIDGATRVGAISPTGLPPSDPVSHQSYQTASAPVSQTNGALGAPAQVPGGYPAPSSAIESGPVYEPPAPQRQGGQLPMIDSDEAMAQSSMGGGGATTIPDEGVNMDAQFGFEENGGSGDVAGLAEEQDSMIAEGNSDQPVVDGIGTDNPVAVGQGQPRQSSTMQPISDDMVVVPPKRQAAGMQGEPQGQRMVWGDRSPVVAPTRVPVEEPQEVAMLMPENPAQPERPRMREVMPKSEVSCRAELRRIGVEFKDLPRISDGPSCGIDFPVLVSGFSGGIDLKPATKLNCQTTLSFAKWVKYELAPSSRYRYLSGVKTIQSMGGYSCRRMNNSRQRYNPMSEHARGNAIDVGKFVLKSGKKIDVRKKGLFSFREGGLLKAVRNDSCKYFNTVLGPGSNAEHWNHFHFDLRSRKAGKRYCD
jgi:hypothetical protein